MNSLYENDIFKDGKVNGYVNDIAAFYGCTVQFSDTAVNIEAEDISSVNRALAAIQEFLTSDFEIIYTTPSGRIKSETCEIIVPFAAPKYKTLLPGSI